MTKVALTGEERSAKKMLDQIVKFIQTNDIESSKLWAILTALRGPDNNSKQLKDKTTARLRYAIGFKTDNKQFDVSSEPLELCVYEMSDSIHFKIHFNTAVWSLHEMKKDEQREVNEKLDALTNRFNNRINFSSDDKS